MELATIEGASSLMQQMVSVSNALPQAWGLLARLATEYQVYILSPSGPYLFDDAFVNRAMFLGPEGGATPVDKYLMTPWERNPMGVEAGKLPQLFDTSLGLIGVQICYDCEFPLPTRAMVEAGMDLLLIPSATETLAGYHRVRIGAQARALEGQIVTVQSPTQGKADWGEVGLDLCRCGPRSTRPCTHPWQCAHEGGLGRTSVSSRPHVGQRQRIAHRNHAAALNPA